MPKLSTPPESPPPPHTVSSGERPKKLSRRKIIALSLVIIVILTGVAIYLAAFPPLPEKYARITYNIHHLNQVDAQTPQSSFIYLVLNMTIYNHGYLEFDLHPLYFAIQVDNKTYVSSVVSLELDQAGYPTFKLSDFSTSVPILKEQTLNGAVAFEVPGNYTQSTPIYPYIEYLPALTSNYVIIWTKG